MRHRGGIEARPYPDGPAHDVLIQHDGRGVVVWCSCNRWGYAGPDESKALDAFRTHVEEETRTGPGEQAGGAE